MTRPDQNPYDIGDLSAKTGMSKRTIRFYIQEGIVSRPEGTKRAARYGEEHLLQLRSIQALRAEGVSLDGIRSRFQGLHGMALGDSIGGSAGPMPPLYAEKWTRVPVARGVELHINGTSAEISDNDLGALRSELEELVQKYTNNK